MGKDQWPDNDLRRASRVLEYKWRMLHECHDLLSSNHAWPDPVNRALVESRLLHTRALIEFFFKCQPRPGDIHVCRWFARSSDEHLCFADHKYRCTCCTEKSRIDKHLAHLTDRRISEIAQRYEPYIIRRLDKLMAKVLELARENQVDPVLRDRAEALKGKAVRGQVYGTKDADGPRAITRTDESGA